VTLKISPTKNDHGVRVSHYELWIDEGDNTLSSFRKLDSYSTYTQTHTIDVVTDSLGAAGTIYRVKILAVNEDDLKSDFSNECLFKLGSLPS
jgi:hypothetical protein